MKNNHIIDTAVFDIAYVDQGATSDQLSALDNFVSTDLMSVVNEVFDIATSSGSIFRLSELEIDLGTVSYDQYQDEMPKRLREQLTDILNNIRLANESGQSTNSEVLEKESADIEQLYHFLRYGQLPWYSRVTAVAELESLLEQAIVKNPEQFKSFLISTPYQNAVIERLFKQFSDNSTMCICRMLLPAHYQTLQNYIDELKVLCKPGGSADLPSGVELDNVIVMMWHYMVSVSVSDNSHQFSTEQLFEQALITVLVDTFQIENGTLVEFLTRLKHSSSSLQTIGELIGNLHTAMSTKTPDAFIESAAAEPADDGEHALSQQKKPLPDLDEQLQMLISALLSGDSESIKPYWSVLCSDHPQLLEKSLRFYGQRSMVRERIARGFTDSILNDIVVLLEPADSGFVRYVIDHSELFYAAIDSKIINQIKHKKDIWAISLGYLLVERETRFNKKAYLTTLIRQISRATGQSQSATMTVLIDNFGDLAKFDRQSDQLLQLLEQQAHDYSADADRAKSDTDGPLDCYDSYQRVKGTLTARIVFDGSNEASILEAIEVLRYKAPWLLMRIYRELQAGAYSWNEGIDRCDIAVLRELVYAFLSLTVQAESSRQTELIDAIRHNARNATNLKKYYQHILRCLIKESSIDFDSIAEDTTIAHDDKFLSETLDSAVSPPHQVNKTPREFASDAQAMKYITDILNGDQHLTGSQAEEFSNTLALMITRQPIRLRQLLESGIADQKFIKRLAVSVSERLHVNLLSLMDVGNYFIMLQCADILATACCTDGTGVQPRQLDHIKWTLIYSYLAESGYLFNQDDFTRQYVESFLPHVSFKDSQQFRTLVSQQLQRNILPSTRALTQRLIQSLSSTTSYDISISEPVEGAIESGSTHEQADDPVIVEEVYISNAGLVLAAPYLPRLFETLGLTRHASFIDRQAAERGVHLLQFLVNSAVSTPEYQLVLNKLLCGVKAGRPVTKGIEPGPDERTLLESMLQAMIQHWKPLANTSISGLRESFLQRNGKLQLKDDAWHLSVEAKAFDMLLDQIPWSYSTIKFPWMGRVIYVEWR